MDMDHIYGSPIRVPLEFFILMDFGPYLIIVAVVL